MFQKQPLSTSNALINKAGGIPQSNADNLNTLGIGPASIHTADAYNAISVTRDSLFDRLIIKDEDYTPLCKNCRHSLSCVIDSTKPTVYKTCDEDGYEKLGCKTAKTLDEKYATTAAKNK
jgi:hypothetical protein